jgi:hypothetical protein
MSPLTEIRNPMFSLMMFPLTNQLLGLADNSVDAHVYTYYSNKRIDTVTSIIKQSPQKLMDIYNSFSKDVHVWHRR